MTDPRASETAMAYDALLAIVKHKIAAPVKEAMKEKRLTNGLPFEPISGPQKDAYFCEADELFYGGAAGGGKSALLCGLAVQEHRNAIIFRREFPQIKGLVDEVAKILRTHAGYNAQQKIWRYAQGRELEFGSVPYENDKEKYQGRAHDFVGFDEITLFTESQYRFLIGWNRSASEGQRCRVVATGNPPTKAEGFWVVKYWGAWLDPTHPAPAVPGELRWYVVVDGVTTEVKGRGPHVIDGQEYVARSRTFISARLEHNPYLMSENYAATLEGMPEPLRTMMREGRFDVGQRDAEFQVIPTDWIVQAQNRWTADGHKEFAMTAIAFDPAGGGRDDAVIARRHGGWYAPLITEKGEQTADGSAAAGKIISYRRDNAPVVVDAGGGAGHGFGGVTIMRLKDNGVPVRPFNGAGASSARTVDGALHFANKRAECWWRLREALNPDQVGGSVIALPPDPELRADLAAPTYDATARGILIEDKAELRKRLGRSPGKGDAVAYALSEGDAARRSQLMSPRGLPKAVLGHQAARRR
jgi:hypothetical protein